MALEFNIIESDGWYAGNDLTIPFIIYEDDGSTPQNLTGFDLLYQVKRNVDDEMLLAKSIGDGIVVDDPTTGTGELTIDAADTAGWVEGSYAHSLIRSNSPITTLWDGTAFISKAAAP